MTTFIGMSEKLSPPLGPPPPQSSISRQQYPNKRKAWEEHKVLQWTKGCRLKYKQSMTTMDYSFLPLQLLLLNVSKGFLIQLFNGVMEVQIQAISRHMVGQQTSDLDPHQGKLQNHLSQCTRPDVRSFMGQTRVYTRLRV